MKYYLLSGMDEKNDYNFFSNIAEIFKKELCEFNSIVYIPTYPDKRDKCKKLAESNIFKNIGITFERIIVLDNTYTEDEIKNVINENELFFLYGGNPYKQIEFINKYKISELIKNKVIIGLSAGSINMSEISICTKDDEFEESQMYQGMGLVSFSVEPHFDLSNKEVLIDLLEFSKNTDIYALEDDAYIIMDNEHIYFYRRYIFLT